MKKELKNTLVFLLVAAFIVSLAGCSSPAPAMPGGADEQKTETPEVEMPGKINMGTADTGGTYFILGAGLAQVIQNSLNIPTTAEATAGSPENIIFMDSDEMTLGIVSAEDGDLAVKGIERYKKKYDLRAITPLYPNVTQPIVLAKSNIKTISDLKGRKVSVGTVGGGVYTMNKVLLGTLGIDITKDIKAVEIGFSEAGIALQDGTVEAAFQTTGAPAAFALEVESNNPIRIISLSDEEINTLLEKQKYYKRTVIKAGTYRTVTEDVNTIGSWSILATTANLSDDAAYAITKAIYENLGDVHSVHAVGKFISPENLKNTTIPYHPGAIKYFKEKGYVYE